LIHQPPRPGVTLGVECAAIGGVVVLGETAAEVTGLANINLFVGID